MATTLVQRLAATSASPSLSNVHLHARVADAASDMASTFVSESNASDVDLNSDSDSDGDLDLEPGTDRKLGLNGNRGTTAGTTAPAPIRARSSPRRLPREVGRTGVVVGGVRRYASAWRLSSKLLHRQFWITKPERGRKGGNERVVSRGGAGTEGGYAAEEGGRDGDEDGDGDDEGEGTDGGDTQSDPEEGPDRADIPVLIPCFEYVVPASAYAPAPWDVAYFRNGGDGREGDEGGEGGEGGGGGGGDSSDHGGHGGSGALGENGQHDGKYRSAAGDHAGRGGRTRTSPSSWDGTGSAYSLYSPASSFHSTPSVNSNVVNEYAEYAEYDEYEHDTDDDAAEQDNRQGAGSAVGTLVDLGPGNADSVLGNALRGDGDGNGKVGNGTLESTPKPTPNGVHRAPNGFPNGHMVKHAVLPNGHTRLPSSPTHKFTKTNALPSSSSSPSLIALDTRTRLDFFRGTPTPTPTLPAAYVPEQRHEATLVELDSDGEDEEDRAEVGDMLDPEAYGPRRRRKRGGVRRSGGPAPPSAPTAPPAASSQAPCLPPSAPHAPHVANGTASREHALPPRPPTSLVPASPARTYGASNGYASSPATWPNTNAIGAPAAPRPPLPPHRFYGSHAPPQQQQQQQRVAVALPPLHFMQRPAAPAVLTYAALLDFSARGGLFRVHEPSCAAPLVWDNTAGSPGAVHSSLSSTGTAGMSGAPGVSSTVGMSTSSVSRLSGFAAPEFRHLSRTTYPSTPPWSGHAGAYVADGVVAHVQNVHTAEPSPWISATSSLDWVVWSVARALSAGKKEVFVALLSPCNEHRARPDFAQKHQQHAVGGSAASVQHALRRATAAGEVLFYGRVFPESIVANTLWTLDSIPLELPARFWRAPAARPLVGSWVEHLAWHPRDAWADAERTIARNANAGHAWAAQPVAREAYVWPPGSTAAGIAIASAGSAAKVKVNGRVTSAGAALNGTRTTATGTANGTATSRTVNGTTATGRTVTGATASATASTTTTAAGTNGTERDLIDLHHPPPKSPAAAAASLAADFEELRGLLTPMHSADQLLFDLLFS